ncbi:FKBP-type peptidyl-prolyl cis-trans isomerase [Streptomyces avicenniae]|uniref:FKBP-type peptidyl-prolyl cis-trans isomerase n=1 Tax=Streptomyces avicenniae TaxID=500153 RepID=UPI0006999B3B|nr:FKBP-type peptidyl-prolyl cis-trans isomerase [Streptomyces avicenniae]
MTPTPRASRLVAALAVPALLLGLAACGSDDSSDDSPETPAASGPVATASGEFGEEPELVIEEDATVGDDVISDVLAPGDGAEVAEGDYLRLDAVAQTVSDGRELVNTWADPNEAAAGSAPELPDGLRRQVIAQAGVDSVFLAAVTDPMVGATVGSRVQVQGPAADLLGQGAASLGLPEDEGVVWVFDIVGATAVDPGAGAEGEQAPAEDGLPAVEAVEGEGPTITIPEGQDPPAELQQQILIEGDGAEVEAGQALVVQYTGVNWADGEPFDSSWDRDAPSAFQIGTGQVVAGWDEGLVGKHVGDRVLLVIPPDLGYGEQGNQSIPGGSTLVFVVDIVGAV